MKILIVDDEPLARGRIRKMLKNEAGVEFIAEARNGGEAAENIETLKPDIVFLDIEMPDADGFEVLEKLDRSTLSQIPAIIFVTAYDQHALRAFEFHALDYLLKPFDCERFAETLARARVQIKNRAEDDSNRRILDLLEQMNSAPEYLSWLTVKKNERIELFKIENIQWIEAQGNYLLLKFEENSELMRETMNELEKQLDPQTFVRIHRSTIVNVNFIKELQVWKRGEYRVLMLGGQPFTLSRNYRRRFDELLKKRLI